MSTRDWSGSGKGLFYSWENAALNHLDKLHNFLFSVVAAQTDAEGRVNDFRTDPHGRQHVAAVSFGAGASGGNTDPGILEQIDGVLGGNTGNRHAENMGRFMCSVDDHAIHGGEFFHK